MIEETAADSQRFSSARLQVLLEVLTVEFIEFLQVTEDPSALTAQILRDVRSGQQGEVMSQNIAQRSHVLHLRQHKLLRDAMKLPDIKTIP